MHLNGNGSLAMEMFWIINIDRKGNTDYRFYRYELPHSRDTQANSKQAHLCNKSSLPTAYIFSVIAISLEYIGNTLQHSM